MTDLSALSDAELERIANGTAQPSPGSIERTSDAELEAIAKQDAQPHPGNWGMTDEAVDTLTFGGAQKLGAAGAASIDALSNMVQGKPANWSDTYNHALEQSRADQQAYEEQHPYLSRAGQAAGLATGIARLPVASALKGGGVLANMRNAALTGAGYGALGGALQDADSVQDRLVNTGTSAAFGAGFASAVPPVARAGNKTVGAIIDFFANRGADRKATSKLVGELQAQGMTPSDIWKRMNELGPQGMLADVSPNMQMATRATGISDSGAGNTISTRLASRREDAHSRLSHDFDSVLGPYTDPYTVKQEARAVQQTTSPAYKRAKEYSVDIAPAADLVQKQAMTAGSTTPHGKTLQQIRNLLVDENGHLRSNGAQVHDAREQLDDMYNEAIRSGHNKLAGKILDIRKVVDASLKEGVPGFAEADKTYADIARQKAAFEEGRQTDFTRKTSSAEISDKVSKASAPENEMRAMGMRNALDTSVSNANMNPGIAADRMLSRERNMDKLATVVGPDKAKPIEQAINRELTFRETSNLGELGRGSPTAGALETAGRMWGMNAKPGFAGDVMSSAAAGGVVGGPMGAVGGAALGAANYARQRLSLAMTRKASPEVIQRAADMLTATGQARDDVLRSIEATFSRLPDRLQTPKTVERLINAAISQVGGQLGPAASAYVSRPGR
jgi:hypothetical protein